MNKIFGVFIRFYLFNNKKCIIITIIFRENVKKCIILSFFTFLPIFFIIIRSTNDPDVKTFDIIKLKFTVKRNVQNQYYFMIVKLNNASNLAQLTSR